MQIGLRVPHTGPAASPAFIRRYCSAAEELGYGSLWAVDHLVLPRRMGSLYTLDVQPRRMAPDDFARQMAPNYESVSTLLWIAGFTSRVRLGTAVSVLPLRNPLLNASMLATLDAVSGGRLLYGVGVGWLEEEANAMHAPWDRRGARSEEHIAVLRRMWSAAGDWVSFEGSFYSFDEIAPHPRPIQQPPPILVGGHSEVAMRRAARLGSGWIATTMSPERLRQHWQQVRRLAAAEGRDPDDLLLVNSTEVALTESPASPLAESIGEVRARLDEFAEIGVDHLTLRLTTPDPDVMLAAAELLAGCFVAE